MEAALEAGADDVIANDDGSIDVLTDPDSFTDVRDTLIANSLAAEDAEITMRPSTNIALDAPDAQKMVRLLETLDDLDDVQQVYSNADISDEILATL
jgi:transcriptional/translational regulatory protein YebC/TACO1